MIYVSNKKARQVYQVSEDTLRRWANDGKIKFISTKGGHRRYALPEQNEEKESIIYARVSSKKQESDLNRQIAFLQQKYPKYTVIKDIGSGINFKRKGFLSILDKLFKGNLKQVVVFSNDRLARFGSDLIQHLFDYFGATLIIENNTTESKSQQEELAEDLLSIVTVFTAKYHGSRKYKSGDDKDSKKD